jgi:DNA-binding beta-propeller fold protein YncE
MTSSSSGTSGTTGTSTSSGSTSTTSSSSGEGGLTGCATTAKGTGLRGSAIALTSDDKTIINVNRDAGTVSVLSVDYSDTFPKMTLVKELTVCAEPWQVVIDGCDANAYVVCRKDQKVVEITGLPATPTLGKSVSVGSEPTSLALTPNNTKLYVSNWVDGTLSVIPRTRRTSRVRT